MSHIGKMSAEKITDLPRPQKWMTINVSMVSTIFHDHFVCFTPTPHRPKKIQTSPIMSHNCCSVLFVTNTDILVPRQLSSSKDELVRQ